MSTHTKFRCRKGINQLNTQTLSGLLGVYRNPHGAGADIVEIIHTRRTEDLPAYVKDASCGNIILESFDVKQPASP